MEYLKRTFTLKIEDTDYELQAIKIIDKVINDLYSSTGDNEAGKRVLEFVQSSWKEV